MMLIMLFVDSPGILSIALSFRCRLRSFTIYVWSSHQDGSVDADAADASAIVDDDSVIFVALPCDSAAP